MRKVDAILFFLAVAFFVIGTHQALVYSITDAYGVFMLSLGLLFLYGYRKKNLAKKQVESDNKKSKKKK